MRSFTMLYAALSDHIKKNEMGEHVASMAGEDRCLQGFGGKPEGKKPLGRPTHRWEGNIETDLQEIGWGAWTGLIWYRTGSGGGQALVNAMNRRVP
jgi:hypothetical protein